MATAYDRLQFRPSNSISSVLGPADGTIKRCYGFRYNVVFLAVYVIDYSSALNKTRHDSLTIRSQILRLGPDIGPFQIVFRL